MPKKKQEEDPEKMECVIIDKKLKKQVHDEQQLEKWNNNPKKKSA